MENQSLKMVVFIGIMVVIIFLVMVFQPLMKEVMRSSSLACDDLESEIYKISPETLKDKIRGGWAGQVIGCTFGGPTEFQFKGTMIQDYTPILWYDGYLKWMYENNPGLYDDIYVDLTFVEVFEKEGLEAPASLFAEAFANAEYPLWHANQAARYNILHGIMPPESGHWLNNPHADDIDFQIEADFIGLMCPGMPNTASEICDKIGHLMNYGDGYYGGVYVAAMYSLAFVSDDINFIVEEALKVIPRESKYAKCMKDVIRWHEEYPDDWKKAWFKIQEKWSEDVGCPDGVFTAFNIDVKINSPWVVLGLLYGEGDFGKTLSISTRAGDDSDCNPSTAGGILGTMLGYKNIPDYLKQGLAEVEPMDFKYTTISLNDVYNLSYKHAFQVIERNGGRVTDKQIIIRIQESKPVKLEMAFEGHYPAERRQLNFNLNGEESFEFDGIGFAVTGTAEKTGKKDYTCRVEMRIDGKLIETSDLPTNYLIRKNTLFWKYQLPAGKHEVRFKILNPSKKVNLHFADVVIYDNKPHLPKY
jgi:hypothetical protein